MDFKEMAGKIYDTASDFDYMDYEDERESEEAMIASALEKVQEMANDDKNFVALWNALIAIF